VSGPSSGPTKIVEFNPREADPPADKVPPNTNQNWPPLTAGSGPVNVAPGGSW
jgi:hypothetical protein